MAFLISCFLVFIIEVSNCHTILDKNKLLKDKLVDYNKNTRPTYNQSNPTIVNYNLQIVYIQEFDEVQQKLSFIGVPTLNWIDEVIKWNPAEYGGLYTFTAKSGSFWIPNLVLENSASERKPIGDDWQMLRYFSDGSAFYSPGDVYSSVCGADITFYPYDKHTCVLVFTPQGYYPSEVYLKVTDEKIGKSYYVENGGWDLVDSKITVTNSDYYVELFVSITLQRKPRYVIINVILPIIFLSYLSNVVFVIPADCGERISYSITVLLAIAVYLTIVGDNLPKTSFPMSYFSYFVLTMLITSILITMATIFNLRIYHSDESDPITGVWAKLASCFKCGNRNKRKKYTQKKIDPDSRNDQTRTGYDIHHNIHHMMISDHKRNMYAQRPQVPRRKGQHLEITDRAQMTSTTDENDRVESCSWKDVSVALDKIFFVIFFIILSAATIIYVVVIGTEISN